VERHLNRFYVDKLPQKPQPDNERLSLDPSESHHAINVLRLKAGQEVELFDGRGKTATARITEMNRSSVAVEVEEVEFLPPREWATVNLAFAVPKGKRLDWLLEKATELGAASLQPVIFERSVVEFDSFTEPKRQKWLTHCIAAAKQSRLNFLPEIKEPIRISDYASGCASRTGCLAMFGDNSKDSLQIPQVLFPWRPGQPMCILVGPEGGLTKDEFAAVRSAGIAPIRLGETTLRVETAVIALLAGVLAVSSQK